MTAIPSQIAKAPSDTTASIDPGSPLQLVLFEKKTSRHAWRYIGTYKAGDQAQLTASENTIRKTFNALHAKDGVQWAVVAREGADPIRYFGLTKKRGRGQLSGREANTVQSLESLGVIVLEFPEPAPEPKAEETPRCAPHGMMLPCAKCAADKPDWAGKEILEREG